MNQFQKVFGAGKPVIGMVHLGALPGSPLHDAEVGLAGLVTSARADLRALQAAGFDERDCPCRRHRCPLRA